MTRAAVVVLTMLALALVAAAQPGGAIGAQYCAYGPDGSLCGTTTATPTEVACFAAPLVPPPAPLPAGVTQAVVCV